MGTQVVPLSSEQIWSDIHFDHLVGNDLHPLGEFLNSFALLDDVDPDPNVAAHSAWASFSDQEKRSGKHAHRVSRTVFIATSVKNEN